MGPTTVLLRPNVPVLRYPIPISRPYRRSLGLYGKNRSGLCIGKWDARIILECPSHSDSCYIAVTLNDCIGPKSGSERIDGSNAIEQIAKHAWMASYRHAYGN